VDDTGAVYVTGFYELWAAFGDAWLAARPGLPYYTRDMFIARFDSGGALQWIRDAGSNAGDEGRGVAVDHSGHVYVIGLVQGNPPAADVQIGPVTLAKTDRFTAKYDADGNLLWAAPAGGSAIAVDDSGNLYLAGDVTAPPVQIGDTVLTNQGAFLAKYDGDARPIWARQAAGTSLGVGRLIAPAGSEAVYFTGAFRSNAAFDGVILTNSSAPDASFLAKYSGSGDLLWARKAEGTYFQNGSVVTADRVGGCYWAGAFTGRPMLGGSMSTSPGEVNTFLTRFSSEGDLQWLRQLNGTNVVLGRALGLDRFGSVLLSGEFKGNIWFANDLNPTLSSFDSPSASDGFLAWYDGQGNFRGARQIVCGSFNSVSAFSMAADISGPIYLTGQFGGYPSPGGETIRFGPSTLANQGFYDFYVAKLDALPPVLHVAQTAGEAVISWPSAATNYVLQSASSLSAPDWNVVTNAPVSGPELKRLSLPLSDRSTFNRLSQP